MVKLFMWSAQKADAPLLNDSARSTNKPYIDYQCRNTKNSLNKPSHTPPTPPLQTNIIITDTNSNNNNITTTPTTNNNTPIISQTHTTTNTNKFEHFHRDHSKRTKMEKIDIIQKINGNFGTWQFRTVLLIFLCKIPSSWFMACIIFTAPAPRHGEFFCRPPESAVKSMSYNNHSWEHSVKQNKTDWIKILHPLKEEAVDQEFNIDFCNVYDDAEEHAINYFHNLSHQHPWDLPKRNGNVIPCETFLHHSDYKSIITDYDLVCSRDILVATTQFFHLFGVLTGGIVAVNLLKFVSPKSVMLLGMVAQIFCGNMTGHVNSYGLHVFFRCLSAVCCAQMYTAGQMIFTDITAGKARTVIVCMFEQFWSIGVILLPGVASFFSSWSHIYMAISWPTVILIVLLHWIPNSPRWLILHGRIKEAKEILLESAKYNDRMHRVPVDLDDLLEQQALRVQNQPEPAGWWSIWKGPRAVRHVICVHLAWSIYIVIYYGMLLNIRAFSRDHLEVNTVVAGICEIIGTFIGLILILKTTRKWFWTGLFNIIGGFFAFTAWAIPHTIKGDYLILLLMITAMVSKIAISSTLSILTTCTIELVCDEKKKVMALSTIVWARIWLLTAPFVGVSIIFGRLVPQTCFGILAIIGGLLTVAISSPRTLSDSNSCTSCNTKHSNLSNTDLQPPQIWTINSHEDKIKL